LQHTKKKTGASINLPVFFKSLPFAFVMFVARAVCIIIGSAVPGYFLKQSKVINLTIWMTLLPQGVPIFPIFQLSGFQYLENYEDHKLALIEQAYIYK